MHLIISDAKLTITRDVTLDESKIIKTNKLKFMDFMEGCINEYVDIQKRVLNSLSEDDAIIRLTKASQKMETRLNAAQEKLETNIDIANTKMEESINNVLKDGLKQLQEKQAEAEKDTRILITSQLTTMAQVQAQTMTQTIAQTMAQAAMQATSQQAQTTSSVKLGQEGEDEVLEYLYTHFANFNIESKGRTSHSNDIILTSERESTVISIEVKNKKNITREDIAKFEKDNIKVKTNHLDYNNFLFLFISLGCAIPDKDAVDFSFDEEYSCTAYLTGHGVIESKFLKMFVQFIKKSRQELEERDEQQKEGNEIIAARQTLDVKIQQLNTLHQNIDSLENAHASMKKSIDAMKVSLLQVMDPEYQTIKKLVKKTQHVMDNDDVLSYFREEQRNKSLQKNEIMRGLTLEEAEWASVRRKLLALGVSCDGKKYQF